MRTIDPTARSSFEAMTANEARRFFREKFIEAIGELRLKSVIAGVEWSDSDRAILTAEWEGARAQAIRNLRRRTK